MFEPVFESVKLTDEGAGRIRLRNVSTLDSRVLNVL